VQKGWVRRGVGLLTEAGFRPVLARHLFARRGHLAGKDDARAEDLNRMLRDPDIRCVLMGRGGFGALRIVDRIDWGAMRRDPKVFAGFSDATLFHLGFAARAGVRTLHGPNLHGIAVGAVSDFARWRAWVTRPDPPEAVRRLPAGPALAAGGGGGKARGRVYGGNLVLVHYATGTRFMPDLGRAILFLEEVAEEPYKIDGMLSRLALEGTLRKLRGVALGSFTACVPKRGRRELPTSVVLRDHLARLGIPVLSGIPAGHGKRNRPVPLGALATIDARRRVLRFEEGLVS
jgi:muramoyltetrapeptide carboxypeptidase